MGKKIIIPINMIEGFIEVKDFNKLKPVRSMGSGGLFGYYESGFFAISPERPELLLDWLKSTTGTSSPFL